MYEWQAKDDGSFRVYVPMRPEGDGRLSVVDVAVRPFVDGPGVFMDRCPLFVLMPSKALPPPGPGCVPARSVRA